jgi:hypothetical protein
MNDETDAMPTPPVRIQRGVEFLNARHPEWISKVTLDALDMSKPGQCILSYAVGPVEYDGGLHAHWAAIMYVAGLTSRDCQLLGFSVDNDADYRETYATLDLLWSEYITARRKYMKRKAFNDMNAILDGAVKESTASVLSDLQTVHLTEDEIEKAYETGELNIITLNLNGEIIRGSWETISKILANLQPGDLEVTLR